MDLFPFYINKVFISFGTLLITDITSQTKKYLRFCPAVSSCDFQLSKRWEGELRAQILFLLVVCALVEEAEISNKI